MSLAGVGSQHQASSPWGASRVPPPRPWQYSRHRALGRVVARCRIGPSPQPPRLEPCMRLSPHTAQHLSIRLRLYSHKDEVSVAVRRYQTEIPPFNRLPKLRKSQQARGLRHWGILLLLLPIVWTAFPSSDYYAPTAPFRDIGSFPHTLMCGTRRLP